MAGMPIGKRTLPKSDAPAVAEDTPAESGSGSRDFKSVMARINRAGWAELRRLAIDLDRPLEDILIDALNRTLSENGRAPVIEKRSQVQRKG
jgi:hypothetical protein